VEENERDGVRFISAGRENEKNSMTRYRPNQRLIAKHPWREMNTRQKISAQICLRTYLWSDEGERKGWVFHIREPAAALSDINITESFCTLLCRYRDNLRTLGDGGQHLTWVTEAEMKCRDKKEDVEEEKKVQLRDVDCEGFCCYSAKGKAAWRCLNRITKAGGHVPS